jgi:DNA-binding response OmpR family regulator
VAPRVLIVEDHSSVRQLLRVVLETEGYRAVEAQDGPSAVETAESVKPDLVILDLMMPGLDGEWVLGQLKSKPEIANTPVVVVTAKAEAVPRMRELLGEGNVFPKPFDQTELLARISELVGPGEARSDSPWKGQTRRG